MNGESFLDRKLKDGDVVGYTQMKVSAGLRSCRRCGETLSAVKELAKQLLGQAETEAQRNAATVLYHAAAAAFWRHGVTISTRPAEARPGLYEDLATALTAHPDGEVFRAAVDRALKKVERAVIRAD